MNDSQHLLGILSRIGFEQPCIWYKGRRVDVLFKEGGRRLVWYRGTIMSLRRNGLVNIDFDDGEVAYFPIEELAHMASKSEIRRAAR